VKLSVGQRHAAALTSQGRLLTAPIDSFDAEANRVGQLGRGNTAKVDAQIGGFAFVPKMDSIIGSARVKDVACGYEHTVFSTDDGRAFAFGSNEWEVSNRDKADFFFFPRGCRKEKGKGQSDMAI
jgi:alpha-tubulin suppressor-like RCC1 family protein